MVIRTIAIYNHNWITLVAYGPCGGEGRGESAYVADACLCSVTRGVSGADLRPDKGRGRREARRSSAAVRSDWTLLPTVRNSIFKWQSEHIAANAAP